MASSKMLRATVVAAVAVSAFAGVAFAADAPAPSPTSGAAAVSSSLVAAVLCPAVALLLGNLRHWWCLLDESRRVLSTCVAWCLLLALLVLCVPDLCFVPPHSWNSIRSEIQIASVAALTDSEWTLCRCSGSGVFFNQEQNLIRLMMRKCCFIVISLVAKLQVVPYFFLFVYYCTISESHVCAYRLWGICISFAEKSDAFILRDKRGQSVKLKQVNQSSSSLAFFSLFAAVKHRPIRANNATSIYYPFCAVELLVEFLWVWTNAWSVLSCFGKKTQKEEVTRACSC